MRTAALVAWAAFAVPCLALAGIVAVPALGLPRIVAENTSDSMPTGFYVLRPGREVQVGDIVILPNPPNHREPWIMKWVVGMAPAEFCWRPEIGTHTLGTLMMPPPLPQVGGKGPPPWTGCRKLLPGEVVGYGETPASYDSRYLGPLPVERLWGSYWLAWGDEKGKADQARVTRCQETRQCPPRPSALLLLRDFIPWPGLLGRRTVPSR